MQDENSVEGCFQRAFFSPSSFCFIIHGCRRNPFLVFLISSLAKVSWRLEHFLDFQRASIELLKLFLDLVILMMP